MINFPYKIENKENLLNYILFIATIVFALLFTKGNFLLFHVLAEGFSILISFMIFVIAYHSRNNCDEPNLTFLGYSYLFVGIVDLLHTITYKGMNIIPSYEYYANQLWIVARYIESISYLLFISFYYINIKKINLNYIILIYYLITLLSVLSIFYWKIFPECFIEGKGQTAFKIISEYIIMAIFFLAIILLYRKKKYFTNDLYKYLFYSMAATIISEFCFTLYVSNYGISNIIGHIFKIISFVFIYQSIIVVGIEKPYNLLFSKLKANESRLLELNITKDKFFSIIAHDLKNPFSNIIGFSDLMLEDFETTTKEEIKENLTIIRRSALSAYKLLENLLYWSRLQMGMIEFHPEKIDLYKLILEVIEFLSFSAKLKNIEIEFTGKENIFVSGDKEMLKLVIRNIISNAIKFTKNDGKIIVNLEENSSNVKISIKDNGIGIPKNLINNLFKLENKASRKGTNNEDGTGLGLILSNDFINKHSGKIIVESEENKGSNFIILLPLFQKEHKSF